MKISRSTGEPALRTIHGSIHQQWQLVRMWSARADVLAALVATIALRIVCSTIGALVYAFRPGISALGSDPEHYLSLPWLHWDTAIYIQIAMHGYSKNGITFYMPLYPFLIRVLGILFDGHFLLAALVISTVATFGAFLCLYQLTEKFSSTPSAPEWALKVAALLPVSFFLVAAYSEALFLWITLGAILAYLQRQWGRLAVLAVLATLTRHPGLLLSVLILPAFASVVVRLATQGWAIAAWQKSVPTLSKMLLAGLAGPAAYLVWAIILGPGLHLPLQWEPLGSVFDSHLHFTWPGSGVIEDIIVQTRGPIPEPLAISSVLDAFMALGAGITLLLAARRLPLGLLFYAILCWCMAVVKVQPDGLTVSAARYLLPLLPFVFLPAEVLAKGNHLLRVVWVTSGAVLLLLCTCIFVVGGWIG